MNPRLARLSGDYSRIRTEFARHKYVRVEAISGNPPEHYRITYRVPGVRMVEGRPIVVNQHVAEIYLHANYPREKPKCTLVTPIWHPNFGSYICIGDHWAAGESLFDVIVQIGDMIQYKIYNPKSPLNGEAARWAIENRHMFPVGNIDLLQPEPEIEISSGAAIQANSLDVVLGPPKNDSDDLGIVLG